MIGEPHDGMLTRRPSHRSRVPFYIALVAAFGLVAALVSGNATTRNEEPAVTGGLVVVPLSLPPPAASDADDTPRAAPAAPRLSSNPPAPVATELPATVQPAEVITPPPTTVAFVTEESADETPVEVTAATVPAPVETTASEPLATPDLAAPDLAAPDLAAPEPASKAGRWQTTEVRRGDTLSAIFKRLGLSQGTLHEMLLAGPATNPLQRLRPGHEVRIRQEEERLHELRYAIDPLSTLQVILGPDGWRAQQLDTPVERRTRYVGGTISDSFYASALNAGLDDRLIMEMAGIFGWDIDFALDIRTGDRFTVLHEELYDDEGRKLLDGAILAAGFSNRDKTFRAVRFTTPDGRSNFFSPDGYAMRKAFLRSPVDFRRISSRFRTARNHPVLGVKRPHRGVDYAAATGTPVKASGDGKVVHVGKKGGYGKTVILRHGGRYQTLYAHLSRYARGMRSGRRVSQGDVIGYVGSTGLATGPHLHYEFLVDGVHRNPLTVKLPQAEPLAAEHLPAFREMAAPLLARLDLRERSLVASSDTAGNTPQDER